MLDGRENGLPRISPFVLKEDMMTHKIGKIETTMVKMMIKYVKMPDKIFLISSF